jgi:predicted CoA-binding protein
MQNISEFLNCQVIDRRGFVHYNPRHYEETRKAMLDAHCEIPEFNPPSETVRAIFRKYRTVAVVGLSAKPERDSYKVAEYLKGRGFKIVPVNPGQKAILDETCYRSLKDLPFSVDIVDIFRRPEAVPPIVDEAVAIGAKVIWMQLGIVHNEAARKARGVGLEVVMDKCIKIEHMRIDE